MSTSSSRSHLLSTSYANEDGGMATVIMNSHDEAFDYRFFVGSDEVKLTIPARAIQTLVY